MKSGYYLETKHRLGDSPWVTHKGPKDLEKVVENFNFLNDRLGKDFHVRIVFVTSTTIRSNDA